MNNISAPSKITVIDSIMGSGKTTWMLNKLNKDHGTSIAGMLNGATLAPKKYIYITPSLNEVDRVTEACSSLQFKNPQPIEGRKLHHLETLIRDGENICCTHALFSMLNKEIYTLLKDAGYTLVIDEVLDAVTMYSNLTKKDKDLLLSMDMVRVDPDSSRLNWNENDYSDYTGKFLDIKELCRNGNLVLFRDTLLLWEFPIEFFDCFTHTYVLTYLFAGTSFAAYLRAGKCSVEMMGINNGELAPWLSIDERSIKANLKNLINIYEGPMNKIGNKDGMSQPLSSRWFERQPEKTTKELKGTTEYFFKKVAKTPAKFNAYTTYKKMKPHLGGARYKSGFLPINLKSTNDYIDKKSLAYLANYFHHPMIRGYFTDRGIPVYDDLHALNEMIQWIFRSQIRRGDPINLFIPSERMRTLLKIWLEADTVYDMFEKTGNETPTLH